MELGDKGNEHRADVVGSNLNGTPARRVSDLDDFVLLVHAHLHDRGLVHLHAFEQHRDRAVAAMGQAPQKTGAGCGVEAALQGHPAAAAFVGDGKQHQGCAGNAVANQDVCR